jgi:hypothetical protein
MTRVGCALLAMVGLALGACQDRQVLAPDEGRIVAWYVEDIAHGHPRRSDELLVTDASVRMEHIAAWAAGDRIRERQEPPEVLRDRRQRLPALAAAFAQGQVVLAPGGLVAPRPGLSDEVTAMASTLADAENHDRRALDGIIVGMGGDDPRGVERYLSEAVAARIALDQSCGAQKWSRK